MLRDFLLRHAEAEGARLAPCAAQKLGVTRSLVNLYLRDLVAEGLLEASGATRARRYRLKILDRLMVGIDFGDAPRADRLWREKCCTLFAGLPENIRRICEAGFTEVMGNAIAHSGGRHALGLLKRNYANTVLRIDDDGIGIFDRLARELGLPGRHEAVLELAKGHLAPDGGRKGGQGLFFAIRMFDAFIIHSGGLKLTVRRRPDGGHSFQVTTTNPGQKGTTIQMEIATDATHGLGQAVEDEAGITVPVALAQIGGENLVSRAQARRVMARCEAFAQVVLDFDGVAEIGPQFADEIFRVWTAAHPGVRLQAVHACRDVSLMLDYTRSGGISLANRISARAA